MITISKISMTRKRGNKIIQVVHLICYGLNVHNNMVSACIIITEHDGKFHPELLTVRNIIIQESCFRCRPANYPIRTYTLGPVSNERYIFHRLSKILVPAGNMPRVIDHTRISFPASFARNENSLRASLPLSSINSRLASTHSGQ